MTFNVGEGLDCYGGPFDYKKHAIHSCTQRLIRRFDLRKYEAGVYNLAFYELDFAQITPETKMPFWRYFELTHAEAERMVLRRIWPDMKSILPYLLKRADDIKELEDFRHGP